MAKKTKQLSLMPFLGNAYTVYVVKNQWGPVWHVQDKHGHIVNYPHQPKNFTSQQAACTWAADLGYKVEIKESLETLLPITKPVNMQSVTGQ